MGFESQQWVGIQTQCMVPIVTRTLLIGQSPKRNTNTNQEPYKSNKETIPTTKVERLLINIHRVQQQVTVIPMAGS